MTSSEREDSAVAAPPATASIAGPRGGAAPRPRWRHARVGIALLLAIGIGAHGRQAPQRFGTQDPLSAPRPAPEEPLVLPLDDRAAGDKIVATMPLALRALGEPDTVRVIVTLHEPLGPRGAGLDRRAQARRLARIAAVEHDFVAAAGRIGFRPAFGLSHFAIVVGDIEPRRLGALAALRQVSAVQPDRPLRAARAQGMSLVRSDELRNQAGAAGEDVVVVVLDSGIDASHPELSGTVEVVDSYNGPEGVDAFGHGTQVAGIIAGEQGLAPDAVLWDIKVIGADGMTTVSILIEALNGLMDHLGEFQIAVGAFADPLFRFPTECDSLDPASTQVVQAIRDAGILLIGAAGDNGDATSIAVPACLSQIRAAGAVYDANVGSVSFAGCTDATTAADKIACYSNAGQLLDFWAPGHRTRSPRAGGGHDESFGGTSAAAAYVAGVAAQILSQAPGSVSLTQLENALRNNGPNINDPRSGITRRRLDAVAAFNALGGAVPSATPPAPTPTRTHTPQGPGPTHTPQGPGPTNTPQPPAPTPTTPAGSAPGAPSALAAEALTHTAVLLEWNDNSNNESDFQIRARTGGAAFTQVLVVPAGTVFAAIEDLQPNTSYDFQVRARNAAGNSAFSNTATVATSGAVQACAPGSPDMACLLGGKFRISGEMRNFANPPATFQNQVMSFAGGRAESDQAVFFESFEAGNFEIGVKMVNGCAPGGFPEGHPLRNFWVFFGGLTNQFTEITVRDTVTGETVAWTNPANQFPTSVSDTMAFPCEQLGAPVACVRDAETACLIDGRFEVTGFMRNAQSQQFVTKVIQFAQNRAETNQAVFFESFNPGNFEVGVKMLDACSLPDGHPLRFYWIFYGGLTSAYAEVIAVHLTSGRVDVWRNPPNALPTSEGRTQAFPCE